MSNIFKTIFKNTIWLSLAEILSGVLLFFLTVFLAKHLGAEDYGKLSFALSFATLFSIIIDFGFSILMIREVARDKRKASKFLNNIFTLRLFLGFLFLLLLLGIVIWTKREPIIVYLVFLAGLQVVLNQFSYAFIAIFKAFEKMEFEAISKIIFSLSLFTLGLFFIHRQSPLVYFGWSYVLAAFLAFLFVVLILNTKFIHFRLGVDFIFWKYLIKESWPFALSLIFVSIYYYLDSIMLGFMGQDEAVGWYNAAYKIIFFILAFVQVIGGTIIPIISRLYNNRSLSELKNLLVTLVRLMIIIAIPLGFAGTILGDKIISFIFGPDYLGGVLAFRILIWTVATIFINIVFANSLQACDKQKIYVLGVATGALINVIFNFILIPFLSLNGAAIATLIADITFFLFMYRNFQKVIRIPFFGFFPRPIISAILMSTVLIFIKDLNIFLVILLGMITYFSVMLVIKGISKKEIHFLKNLILNRI